MCINTSDQIPLNMGAFVSKNGESDLYGFHNSMHTYFR